MITKTCRICKITKPIEQYRIRTDVTKLCRRHECTTCQTIINRNQKLKSKFGINQENYIELANFQNNKCKICNRIEETKYKKFLSIDHCHITGKIRGLLCHHCNVGLGGFKDNLKLLKKAIKYLEESEA